MKDVSHYQKSELDESYTTTSCRVPVKLLEKAKKCNVNVSLVLREALAELLNSQIEGA